MMDYRETLDYLYGLEKFGMVFGLDNVLWILSLLGNPQDSFRSVHVAGTNGKGSVVSMVATTLKEGGYRTGTYTSPHLISFTERIAVNEEPIAEKEVVRLTRIIKARIDEENRQKHFTFFDFTTALAFEYFKEQGADVAVVEVGLGGRLDSTNVIQPLVSVITNVEFDHQEFLGNTIEEIAREKAGVIKDGVPVVTGAKGAALDVVRKAASGRADLYVLGEHFSFAKKGEQVMDYTTASAVGLGRSFDALSIALKGDHQLINASLALCTLEILASRGFTLEEKTIRRGLSATQWPGRLEVIPETPVRPMILLDGAHNPDGARSLATFLRTHFQDKRKILVFGVMKDKDFKEMLSELTGAVDEVVLTKPEIARAALPADVAVYAPDAMLTGSVRDGLNEAFGRAHKEDMIIIAGSFYTVGEAKRLLDEPV